MPTLATLTLRPIEEFGPVLAGRTMAAKLRQRIETAAAGPETVVVDFAGVVAASPSFADELFGKLPPRLTEEGKIRFENLSEDLWPLVRFVVRHRQGTSG